MNERVRDVLELAAGWYEPVPPSVEVLARRGERHPRRTRVAAAAIGLILTGGTIAALVSVVAGPSDRVAEPSPPHPTLLSVDCTTGDPVLNAERVAAQSDGVHFAIEVGPGIDGFGFQYVVGDPADRGWSWAEASRGTDPFEIVAPLQPGDYLGACWREGENDLAFDAPDARAFTVVDPAGLWHSDALGCSERPLVDGILRASDDPSLDASADVDTVIRAAVGGIDPNDMIEYAGYPDTERGAEWTHRVIRDGAVVARVTVSRSAPYVVFFEACPASGLGEADTALSVPDVTGSTRAQAIDALQAAGLAVAIIESSSEDVPEGAVASQDPPPGTRVAAGTEVVVTVSAGPQPLDTLHVTCTDSRTLVSPRTVLASMSGVRIVVDDPGGWDGVMFAQDTIASRGPVGWNSGDTGIDQPFTLPIPPGETSVACYLDRAVMTTREARFEVNDPDGVWVSTDLACIDDLTDLGSADVQAPVAADASTEDLFRASMRGIRRDDVVEAAGYDWEPGGGRDYVRVVRDGETLAVGRHYPFQGGIAFSYQACPGSRIERATP